LLDAVQDSKQYIITADGTDEWLGTEEFLLATIVRQFLVSFHIEAVPILYKSLKQNRLSAHKNKNKMLYLEVKKNNIWKDIPLSKDDIVRGASLSANLDLSQSSNTDFSGEDSKILDGITWWLHIHDVDFNLKQSLMMGIFACTLMDGQGNQSKWAELLAKSGKAVANILWEVLRGERSPASAKDKGFNLTDDVSLLQTVALSGVTCVFGDKNSFAELAKNLGAKFKNIKKKQTPGNARYDVIIAQTYRFFKDSQFLSSTGMTCIYNTDCKQKWSLSALYFWRKVVNEVSTKGSRVNKDTILAAIANIESIEKVECSHGDERSLGDPMTNTVVSLKDPNTPMHSPLMTPSKMASSSKFPSSPDDSVTSFKIITPESADDAVICNQNLDNTIHCEDRETFLQRYESNVKTPAKESLNVLERIIKFCDKVTNAYGEGDNECDRYWIQEPTEADFQALVDEDTGDMAGA
jgi:hypothetical protein